MLGCLTMRMICNSRFCSCQRDSILCIPKTNLETLILQNSLDRCVLAIWGKLCLEDHTKGTIAYNLALRILHFLGFASEAILDFLTNDLFSND